MGKLKISVTEDAYKIIVKPEVGELFKEYGYKAIEIEESVLISKLKNYKINDEDKKIRIISAVLDNGRVVDISVLKQVTDKLIWDNRYV